MKKIGIVVIIIGLLMLSPVIASTCSQKTIDAKVNSVVVDAKDYKDLLFAQKITKTPKVNILMNLLDIDDGCYSKTWRSLFGSKGWKSFLSERSGWRSYLVDGHRYLQKTNL